LTGIKLPVIEIESLTFGYRAASDNALQDINLSICEGEFVVIMGPNEAGKSTLCFTLNGLIPHLVRGNFEGHVVTDGKDTLESKVSDLFPSIGLVFQDFEAQLFSTEVELEIAFAPENLGLTVDEIRQRINRALEITGLDHLRGRQPATLSGGQKQLLAIASTLSLEPRILCFDEPTTDLDPENKHRIFSLTRRLSEKRRQTLIMVEHETEEALSADRIVLINEGRIIDEGSPGKILRNTGQLESCRIKPLQVTELFEKLDSDKLPLSIEEAKTIWQDSLFELRSDARQLLEKSDSEMAHGYGSALIEIDDVHFSYEGGIEALRGVSLNIHAGEFVAILGQNGSGKTTLAKHLNGLLKPARGEVLIEGTGSSGMSAADLGRHVGYVFQNPDHQIFEERILDEVMFGPKTLGIEPERAQEQTQDALETVGLWERRDEDPFMLTKGLRQKVAVASVLATRPRAIVLDEPTTGLDYGELKQMMSLIQTLNNDGHTIIVITHCIWIAAEYAHRTILMSDGKIISDGPTRYVFAREDLLAQAGIIAPQIVRFSNELGTTILSVDEFLRCMNRNINPGDNPNSANPLKNPQNESRRNGEQ
jgi:energy-coupling factor transporter ATP-binding protein EcfA2